MAGHLAQSSSSSPFRRYQRGRADRRAGAASVRAWARGGVWSNRRSTPGSSVTVASTPARCRARHRDAGAAGAGGGM